MKLALDIPRYAIPSGEQQLKEGRVSTLSPSPMGEWCRYKDACGVVEKALGEMLQQPPASAPASTLVTPLAPMRCEHKIEIERSGIAVMYCALPLGHAGKCSVEGEAERKAGQ